MRELADASRAQSHKTEDAQSSEEERVMVECLAIRNGLLEACKEIQEAMRGIRQRLSGLSVDVQASAGNQATPSPITAPSTENVELEGAVKPGATSDLSHNAA